MINNLNVVQLSENETKRPVMIQKKLTYENVSTYELHQIFQELKNEGKIINEKYADDVWIVLDRTKDVRHRMNMGNIKSKNELKAFLILHLKNNQPENSGGIGRFLIKVLDVTNELQNDEFDIKELGVISQYMKWVFFDFLDFIEADSRETRVIVEKIEEYASEDSNKSRALPNYQSIMIFDTIIDKFVQEDLKDYPEYYPIVLWWKLTTLIPMRPIEFFMLKKWDFNKRDDGYYIHITRSLKSDTENKNNHPIPLIEEFKIDEKLYDLFVEYIDTQEIADEGFIFNSNGHDIINKREFMGRSSLQWIHRSFFIEVVENKYGYNVIEKESQQFLNANEIEYINYGDTRHLAFLNLIISGYNPYTIAQLGGHRTLQTQMSYYSGAVSYCTSKAFSLAFGLIKLDTLDALAMTTWKQNNILNVPLDLSKARKMGDGYCTCENFPYECYATDCSSGECQYYVVENKENIAESIARTKDEIESKIDILKAILYKAPKDSVTRNEACNCIQEKIIELARLYKNISILEDK